MSKSKLKIGVKVQGGFGTVLVRANFLHCLYEYIDDAELQIYACGHKDPMVNFAIFEKQPSIFWYGDENSWKTIVENNNKHKDFSVLFELDLYPRVVYSSDNIKNSPKLEALINSWLEFQKANINAFYYNNLRRSKPYEYSKMIIQRKHILNSADVTGVMDIGREYRMPVNIMQDQEERLRNFGLDGKKYITLQRGINPKLGTTENNKLWPIKYFNELISMIKKAFPQYTIVQLGESEEHCASLEGIDINLLGQTSWDDIKILLKNATLHIDGECGMVHLRKALHAGPSLVFFGPTPVDVFGYDGNFNLNANACGHWCAEIRDDWEYHCPMDVSDAPCMYELLPEMAMKAITPYLSGGDTSATAVYEPPIYRQKNPKLVEEYGNRLDAEYVQNYINDMEVWDYEVTRVPVKKLIVSVFNGTRWQWTPLSECPAYRYLCGETDAYEKNMEQRKSLVDNQHSCERFYTLIDNIEKNGFDDEQLVLISSSYRIKDGQHRAAIWMHTYGEDSTIPVMMLYMRE